MKAFLKSLHEQQLLRFQGGGGWSWDLSKIKHRPPTGNVVDLMIEKIGRLAGPAQEVLKLAACIGNRFDERTLAIVAAQSEEEVESPLFQCTVEGLLVKTDVAYEFHHDRIQEAAYALIPEDDKTRNHYTIGRLLLDQAAEEEVEDGVFAIVDQLNRGRQWLVDSEERCHLARLNLRAGIKAKGSTAHQAARDYFVNGIELLSDHVWENDYDLAFELHLQASECEYLSGAYERAESLFDVLSGQAHSEIDQARVYAIQIVQHANLNQSEQAIRVGTEALKLFGVTLPQTGVDAEIESELGKLKTNLASRDIKDLLELPEMTDVRKRMPLELASYMHSPLYIIRPELTLLLQLKAVNISLRHGHAAPSIVVYGACGEMLGPMLGEYHLAYEFSKLGVRLSEQLNEMAFRCKAYFFYAEVSHWCQRIGLTTALHKKAYQAGQESGDLLYAGYACIGIVIDDLAQGRELNQIYEETKKYQAFLEATRNPGFYGLKITQQCILNLRGLTESRSSLTSKEYDEAAFLKEALDGSLDYLLHWYYVRKLQLAFFYGDASSAQSMAVASGKAMSGATGQFSVFELNFYHSLTLTALYPEAPADEQREYRQKLESNQQQMKVWADNCPENFAHAYDLVAAEMARITGNDLEAMTLYDRAIESARANEFLQNEALANELAANFWLSKGKGEFADLHLTRAHDGYRRWGALRKVEDLEEKHPQLRNQMRMDTPTLPSVPAQPAASSQADLETLDFMTVVKAAQTLSSERLLDQLLKKLMRIVIENAGAQKGFLILERDGQLSIEAGGSVDQEHVIVQQSIPIDSLEVTSPGPNLSQPIVHYVARSRERVLLDDATHEGRFTTDAYIAEHKPKSVLCMPILHQGQLTAILYLENNLSTGAFTIDRLQILNLLSSQIATSIENAMLYSRLEDRNQALEHEVRQRDPKLRRQGEES